MSLHNLTELWRLGTTGDRILTVIALGAVALVILLNVYLSLPWHGWGEHFGLTWTRHALKAPEAPLEFPANRVRREGDLEDLDVRKRARLDAVVRFEQRRAK